DLFDLGTIDHRLRLGIAGRRLLRLGIAGRGLLRSGLVAILALAPVATLAPLALALARGRLLLAVENRGKFLCLGFRRAFRFFVSLFGRRRLCGWRLAGRR